jgi:putative ABC transport system permease protein
VAFCLFFGSILWRPRTQENDGGGADRKPVDPRVLLFTGALSLTTGILFGLAPLFQLRRADANEALKQSARIAGGVQSRMRSGLAVGQVAIAVVLLIGAGLMARSFWTLVHVSPGYRTERVLTARLSLFGSRYPDARRIAVFHRDLLERVRNIPGVQSAGLAAYLPLSGTDNGWGFDIEGGPPLRPGEFNLSKYRPVSAGYFETIGIPLRRGRAFAPGDNEDAPLVVVINESFARRYWGERNPLGQRIRVGRPAWRTVIGVVGDVRHEGLDADTKPELYLSFAPRHE